MSPLIQKITPLIHRVRALVRRGANPFRGTQNKRIPTNYILLKYLIKMKFIASVVAAVAVQSASAFVAGPQCQRTIVSSSTQQSMGLFDFFSEDARKERDARKQAEVEEQEQMQREIIARRSNPKKMEEYEAKVRVRRALRSE